MGRPVPHCMAKKTVTEEAPAPVVREYQCDKGHRWQSSAPEEVNALTFAIGMAGNVTNVCPHCLLNQFSLMLEKMNVGRVVSNVKR